MSLRFLSVYGKNDRKNIELSVVNGLEPASHDKDRMVISNRLRPKENFERDRCASGWSFIYDHSTNPVNKSSCLKATSSFFVQRSLCLTFSYRMLVAAQKDFCCQVQKQRIRSGRVAAGQSPCDPRRWGGRGIRTMCVIVMRCKVDKIVCGDNENVFWWCPFFSLDQILGIFESQKPYNRTT